MEDIKSPEVFLQKFNHLIDLELASLVPMEGLKLSKLSELIAWEFKEVVMWSPYNLAFLDEEDYQQFGWVDGLELVLHLSMPTFHMALYVVRWINCNMITEVLEGTND